MTALETQDAVVGILYIARKDKISIKKISKYLGCSRTSLYNWAAGDPMLPVYRNAVEALSALLASTEDAKEAFDTAYNNL